MKKAQEVYREGFLSHLDQLMVLSENLSVKQRQQWEQEVELQQKREQILKLQRERDELRGKVDLQNEEIQALSARQGQSRPALYNTADPLEDLILEEKRSIMEALWFTGISGQMTDDGVCFCISTAFEGTYLDSYYLTVKNMERPRLVCHSIPPFIPLSDVIGDYLPDKLKKLLSLLWEQLNGYAGRKFQASQMEETSKVYIAGTLQRNSLHTVLSFQYNVPVGAQLSCFSARLFYGDITRTLPTEIKIVCSDNKASLQDIISAHVSMFSSQPLHTALESVTT